MRFERVLVLGCGYVGRVFVERVNRDLPNVTVISSRRKVLQSEGRGEDLGSGPNSRSELSSSIRFDLEDESTWEALPKVDATLWTFAVKESENLQRFLNIHRTKLGKIVNIGTTSSFLVEREGQEIFEDSTLRMEDERVLGEQRLRDEGASTVFASGIYGPGRDPLDWVRSGRVSYLEKSKSESFLNLIHVDDLVSILFKVLLEGENGEKYLASDREPTIWSHLIEFWKDKALLDIEGLSEKPSFEKLPIEKKRRAKPSRLSKRISAIATLKALEIDLEYKNIFKFYELNQESGVQ